MNFYQCRCPGSQRICKDSAQIVQRFGPGVVGTVGQVNYSASKAGLIGATRALAKELASRAITVNCVAFSPNPAGSKAMELFAAENFGHSEDIDF